MLRKLTYAAAFILSVAAISYAQTKISGYPAGTAITGPEIFLADQNGATVTLTANQLKTFIGASSGACSPNCVVSFNGRTNTVTLQSVDVTNALGYSPLNPSNNLSDLGLAATARTNLGLGTAAQQNTGTSGGTLGLLNANNTYSGISTFSGTTASSRRTVNTNTTLSAATDNYVCGDVSGGAITITLPPNTILNGTTIGIDDCKRLSSSHTLTVAANTGQTISGAASITITTNGGAILAVFNSADNDWNLF